MRYPHASVLLTALTLTACGGSSTTSPNLNSGDTGTVQDTRVETDVSHIEDTQSVSNADQSIDTSTDVSETPDVPQNDTSTDVPSNDDTAVDPDAPDPCIDVVCDMPPTPTCRDAQTVTTVSNPGTCIQGECTYTETYQACDMVCVDGGCATLTCADIANVDVPRQILILDSDAACLETVVDGLVTTPAPFIDLFYTLISHPDWEEPFFFEVFDKIRANQFLFDRPVIDRLYEGIPSALEACYAASRSRCDDWERFIYQALTRGDLYRCEPSEDLTASELLEVLPYGGFYCTDARIAPVEMLLDDAMVTALLDLAQTHPWGWSRRNALRVIGTLGQESQPRTRALIANMRVSNTMLAIATSDERDENVLADVIWIVDTVFYPLEAFTVPLQNISANTECTSSIRFRAITALSRLYSSLDRVLTDAEANFISTSIRSDDPFVRAQSAFLSYNLGTASLTDAQEQALIQALNTALQTEQDLQTRLFLARALDHYEGTERASAIVDELEAQTLPNTLESGDLRFRSGLPTDTLQELALLIDNLTDVYFDLLGSDFRTPVPGDSNPFINLVIFATLEEYQDYMGAIVGFGQNAGGLYVERDATLYTYERTPAQSRFTLEELLQHEFSHYLQGRYLYPGVWGDSGYFDQPRAWHDEGLAEVMAGVVLTGNPDQPYTLPTRQDHLDVICGNYRSVDGLIRQRVGYDQSGVFDYPNGWALVYYLVTEQPSAFRAIARAWRNANYNVENFVQLAELSGTLEALEQQWHASIDGWCGGGQGRADRPETEHTAEHIHVHRATHASPRVQAPKAPIAWPDASDHQP